MKWNVNMRFSITLNEEIVGQRKSREEKVAQIFGRHAQHFLPGTLPDFE